MSKDWTGMYQVITTANGGMTRKIRLQKCEDLPIDNAHDMFDMERGMWVGCMLNGLDEYKQIDCVTWMRHCKDKYLGEYDVIYKKEG